MYRPTKSSGGSSNLSGRTKLCLVSSVVEHRLDKAVAVSSILTRGTKFSLASVPVAQESPKLLDGVRFPGSQLIVSYNFLYNYGECDGVGRARVWNVGSGRCTADAAVDEASRRSVGAADRKHPPGPAGLLSSNDLQ